MSHRKSPHQQRIEEFMHKAEQYISHSVTIPPEEVRRLQAALILEEAVETIGALGYTLPGSLSLVRKRVVREPDIVQVADGCADLSVVTIGTLSAFGIADEPLLEEVDESNLRKFGPGAYRREDGKWIKPPNWIPPDIKKVLASQGYVGEESTCVLCEEPCYGLMCSPHSEVLGNYPKLVIEELENRLSKVKQWIEETYDEKEVVKPNIDEQRKGSDTLQEQEDWSVSKVIPENTTRPYAGLVCPWCKGMVSDELIRKVVDEKVAGACFHCKHSFTVILERDSQGNRTIKLVRRDVQRKSILPKGEKDKG